MKGVDVSSNNPHPMDWAQVKAAGYDYAAVKATQDLDYVNPFAAQDVADAVAAGLQVVEYHYTHMQNPAQEEATFFHSNAGVRARILDVETLTDTVWMNLFLQTLGFAQGQEMTYGSAGTLPQTGIRSLLWPAAYGPNPGFGAEWQNSETGQVPGIQGDVDTSVWTGTPQQYNIFFGLVVPVQESDMFIAAHPSQQGYWLAKPDGSVEAFGASHYHGGGNNMVVNGKPAPMGAACTGIASSPTGNGYWLTDAKGEVYSFGDAVWKGNAA